MSGEARKTGRLPLGNRVVAGSPEIQESEQAVGVTLVVVNEIQSPYLPLVGK